MTGIWFKLCVAILAGSALLGASSLALLARRTLEAGGAGRGVSECSGLIPVGRGNGQAG